MNDLSPHVKGLLLTFIGVMALTPDALLIRLADMDEWQMVFWRNALLSPTLLIVLFLTSRGHLLANIKAMGKTGIYVAIAMAISSVTFVLAFENTSAAKALVTVALIPMISAIMSFVFLKERISIATGVACALSLIGIGIVVSDSLHGEANNTETLGVGFAFITAICVASAFVLIRSKPTVSMVPATALGCLALAILLFLLGVPATMTESQVFPVLTLGLFVLPVSFGMLAIGPRFIPAPEVGLLMLLETCLGPYWVWLVLNEEPSTTVLIGGAIVITTLACHAIWTLTQKRQNVPAVNAESG
jgi:drug/metabolite transporter (DMT)-like permease